MAGDENHVERNWPSSKGEGEKMCLGPLLDPAMVMLLPLMGCCFVQGGGIQQNRRDWKHCVSSPNPWKMTDIEGDVSRAELGFHRTRSSETNCNVQHSWKTLGWCINNETRAFGMTGMRRASA